ncbi:hypothetical protein GOP47_0020066 [Adiantum capillus-veneris]|uniref:Uncharacterized protein n=1 Tax=Adiantum capillus-veneris TaxID=13818 RepID=A0A9D4UDU9_ADICA|nr:hypothetical protein GOP47_0020066 [Adiantum capillus-veneris]
MILKRTEKYGKVTLEKFGLGELFPLVSVGMFVLWNGEVEDGSDDDGHHSIPSTSIVKRLIFEPSLSVRVTFLVKKKIHLLHVVGLLRNLQQLGKNDLDKVLDMACNNGLTWENTMKIPCDATLMFSSVVLNKRPLVRKNGLWWKAQLTPLKHALVLH